MAKFTLADGTEVEAFTLDEMKAQIEEVTGGLKSKVEELLGEKKTVSARAAELEEAARIAKDNELKDKEEFKTLYERGEAEKLELQSKFDEFSLRVTDKNRSEASMLAAVDATRDSAKAKLLAEKVKGYIKDNGGVISFEMGGIEVSKEKVLDGLRAEFPFLFDIPSNGGGATGSTSGGAAKKLSEMTATEEAAFANSNPDQYKQMITRG